MSEKISLDKIRERVENLEAESNRDSQEIQFIDKRVTALRSRVRQLFKALKS